MAFVDTKERIFVNGQIYSRPIGGGPVHGPDTRRFTPDPNPYDVAPEPRGYGQGTVDDLLYRPGVDKFEIENPVLRPGDTYEVLPLDFLNQYLEVTPMVVSEMPRYIRGHQHAPRGVIMTVPDIDSRFMNERIKRGFVPMTPPPVRGAGGPQLPGFV